MFQVITFCPVAKRRRETLFNNYNRAFSFISYLNSVEPSQEHLLLAPCNEGNAADTALSEGHPLSCGMLYMYCCLPILFMVPTVVRAHQSVFVLYWF